MILDHSSTKILDWYISQISNEIFQQLGYEILVKCIFYPQSTHNYGTVKSRHANIAVLQLYHMPRKDRVNIVIFITIHNAAGLEKREEEGFTT